MSNADLTITLDVNYDCVVHEGHPPMVALFNRARDRYSFYVGTYFTRQHSYAIYSGATASTTVAVPHNPTGKDTLDGYLRLFRCVLCDTTMADSVDQKDCHMRYTVSVVPRRYSDWLVGAEFALVFVD